MKMFVASLVFILSSMLLFDSNSCLAGIPAPDGTIWVGPAGSTFRNGQRTTVVPTGNGYRISCVKSNCCCWEITDGGKNLEIYSLTEPEPPKPGPNEDSESEVVAVPE